MSMSERKTVVLEEGWDILQKGITKIRNILEGLPEPQFTSEYYMILYTTVYNMCTQRPPHNYGRKLHGKYREAFEEYIISTVLPSLREKKDELLLRELLRRWSNHKIMTRCLSRFFGYIDRCSDIPRLEFPSLEETSFLSFYYLVYKEMNEQVLDAILAMADQKRAGEQIDQTLLINALDFCLDFEERTRKNNAKEEKMHGSPTISSKKINLISSDGDVFEIDYGVALVSKTFEDTIETIPVGDVGSIYVSLVNSKMLTKVIEYCKKHNNAQMDVDLRDWDAQFIDVDRGTLSELVKSAGYLKIDSLVKLADSKLDSELLDLIRGKTPEEIKQEIKQLLASKRAQNSKSQEEDHQQCLEIFS